MKISRRKFISGTSAGVAGVCSLGYSPLNLAMSDVRVNDDISPGAFNYGVASGDPRQDRVILWTHFQPDVVMPVTVHWQLRRQRRRSLSERCEQLRTEARLRGQRRQLDALLELVLVRPRTESAK